MIHSRVANRTNQLPMSPSCRFRSDHELLGFIERYFCAKGFRPVTGDGTAFGKGSWLNGNASGRRVFDGKTVIDISPYTITQWSASDGCPGQGERTPVDDFLRRIADEE